MAKKKRKSRRRVLPLLAAGAAALAGAEIARRVYRERQLFLPSRDPVKSWDPTDYGIPRDAVEVTWFDGPGGERLHSWYCRAKKPVASALFCHGNTGNLTVSADIIPHLLNARLSVLFFDYRGFGRSEGRASVGGVVADGLAAARFHDTIRPQELPSILYGFSMGGAVAAQVIRRHPFDGLILQSTFTSLADLTRTLYPRLPMHLLAGRLFNTLEVVKRLEIPLLVLHGGKDEVIPSRMAQDLHAASRSDAKAIHVVEEGLHKDIYLRDADSLVWAVNSFAESL